MDEVTADQVREAVERSGRRRWRLRSCSMCGVGLHYIFEDGEVGYQSACGCTRYFGPAELRSWQEVADTLNMQSPEVRASMWGELSGAEVAA